MSPDSVWQRLHTYKSRCTHIQTFLSICVCVLKINCNKYGTRCLLQKNKGNWNIPYLAITESWTASTVYQKRKAVYITKPFEEIWVSNPDRSVPANSTLHHPHEMCTLGCSSQEDFIQEIRKNIYNTHTYILVNQYFKLEKKVYMM